jgi:negative modulator of initiation of replication
MKTIEVEDDVYQYIAGQTKEIGEPATSILRRLLGVPNGTQPKPGKAAVVAAQPHELAPLLSQPMFSSSTTAVARMLRIFREVHAQKKQDFAKVLQIQGRNRAYFARSEHEILKSGKSTQPREIEGTGYWVMTNSPTQQKQQMVREVLEVLGYSEAAIEAAVAVIQ